MTIVEQPESLAVGDRDALQELEIGGLESHPFWASLVPVRLRRHGHRQGDSRRQAHLLTIPRTLTLASYYARERESG